MERVMGIEPTYEAWEAAVLPLNYTRIAAHCNAASPPARPGALAQALGVNQHSHGA